MMKKQEYTTLNNGVEMPLLGLGVYQMHKEEAENTVAQALEIGYRLIDTAAMYNNESEVGEGIRRSGIKREDIFITTKVNNPDQGYENALRAFDESLLRLRCDYIDLYLVHWPIRGKREQTWKAFERLYREQKVRAIGVANYLLPFMEELMGYAEITPAVNQVEFTPFLFMKDLLHFCRDSRVQLQSYTPLTKGVKLQDPRLCALAAKYNKTAAQIILRWNIQHGVSTIPKSSNEKRLKENFGIFDFHINEEDMQLIDSFDENFRMVGDPMSML
jgi:diketogulonate reductase-like aldo/keto reductase